MRSITILSLISFVVCLGACAPAAEEAVEEATTTEADVEAINKVREQEAAVINAGDIEGFMAIVTDDAIMMPPNESPVTGKESIRSWLQDFLDQFTIKNYSPSDPEVVVAGDWAFERFSFAWTLVPVGGGEPTQDNGKCIHIYHRQPDGSWKLARDIWNSDNPPPEQ
ncbi:MAG: YybH family protein [Acidobacteriota bacterium]